MIDNGANLYIKQEKAVNNTEVIFKKIISNMETIIYEVNMVYGLNEVLDKLQADATDSIISIAAIAEQTASASQEVLASGEDQAKASEQLVNMSLELSDVIVIMRRQMSYTSK